MNFLSLQIHERAVDLAYLRAEVELISVLQQVDYKKVFRVLGYGSLFVYCIEALKLSEGQAYSLINVARKAKEVPEVKAAVEQGKISLCKARRIAAVITGGNQSFWIEKASSLSQRSLEKEIAGVRPQTKVIERIKPVAENRCELKMGISFELEEKLNRVKDILSQKQGRGSTVEQALEAMVELYLEKWDPERFAARALKKNTSIPNVQPEGCRSVARTISRLVRHQVIARDHWQCTYQNGSQQGHVRNRCQNKRFLELHHRRPLSKGGTHSADNISVVCANHHKMLHTCSIGISF